MTRCTLPCQMYCRLSIMPARQREPKKNLPCGVCKLQLTVQTPLQSLQQSAFTHTASSSNFSAKVKELPRITVERSSTQNFLGAFACCPAARCVSMLCIAVRCSYKLVLLPQGQRGQELEACKHMQVCCGQPNRTSHPASKQLCKHDKQT